MKPSRILLVFCLIFSGSVHAISFGPEQEQHQAAIGVGIGKGGDAEANARARAESEAKARAEANNHNANIGLNLNKNNNENRASNRTHVEGGDNRSGAAAHSDQTTKVRTGDFNDGDQTTKVRTGDFNDGDTHQTVQTGETHQTVHDGDIDAGDVTIGGDTVNSEYREAAASAIAGYGNTTASCFRTLGLGGSTTGSGWSAGIPLKDKDCELGEDAAQAFMIGNYVMGYRLFCEQKNIRKAYGGKFMNSDSHKQARFDCLIEAGAMVDGKMITNKQFTGEVASIQSENDDLRRRLEVMKDAERERRMNETIGTRRDLEALGVTKK